MNSVNSFEQLAAAFFVLYEQGEYAQALDLIQNNDFPAYASTLLCWKMAMQSKQGNGIAALTSFREALAQGHWYAEAALRQDPDFEALRQLDDFESLVVQNNQLHEKAVAKPELVIHDLDPNQEKLLLMLHGNFGNVAAIQDYWQIDGWITALPQSSQMSWANGVYEWNNLEQAKHEIQTHFDSLKTKYHPKTIVIAGFSKGGEIALRTALSYGCTGCILIDPTIPENLETLISQNQTFKCYFVVSEGFCEEGQKAAASLKTHGIDTQIEETGVSFHSYPAKESILRALALVSA